MEDYIMRQEHDEFCKRMESENRRLADENRRQNNRIEDLEDHLKEIRDLTASVRELAANMRNMSEEQERQGKRLEALERRDGDMWRKATAYVITAVIGIVVGYIFKQIGM